MRWDTTDRYYLALEFRSRKRYNLGCALRCNPARSRGTGSHKSLRSR